MATDTENRDNLKANPSKTLDTPVPPAVPSVAAAAGLPEEESQNASTLPSSTGGDQGEVKESNNGDSESAGVAAVGNPDGPVSNMQKKIRRAERFGMPVQMSEEEKRFSRAERFGIGSTSHGSDALKSEEQKRKARAERFGLPAKPVPADEEVKKKARLARFAQVSKIDSVEEDKRKARAARFSVPASISAPQADVKGDVEPAAVSAKASGGV